MMIKLHYSIVAVVLAAGCADDDTLRAGRPGDGKTDGGECASDQKLIADARAWLVMTDSFYGDIEWRDEISEVSSLEQDLNDDGVDDVIVAPGLSYAGANTELVLYLSARVANTDYACPTRAVGHFGATDVVPAEDGARHNGVLDVFATNVSACEAATTRYTFDGKRYVDGETTTERLCE